MEEVVEFLSILNLENGVWYTVRVELEKTCQPQQESSFPAIIEVTDGKSAWRGVSSEDQFFSEIESAFDDEPRVQKCRDVVGILRKASGGRCGGPYLGPTAGYSFSFEDNSGTFEMTYWHTYEPSNNDMAQDFKIVGRFVRKLWPVNDQGECAEAALRATSCLFGQARGAMEEVRTWQRSRCALEEIKDVAKEATRMLKDSRRKDADLLRCGARMQLNKLKESVKDVQKQTGGRPVVELEDAEETERDTGSDFEEDLNTGRDQADEHNAESGKGLPQTNGRDLSEGTSPPRKLKPFKRKRGGEAEQ